MAPIQQVGMARPSDDQDFLKCMDYLMHVEWELKTQSSWAEKWNVDPVTVWRWKTGWNKRGLMSACREVIGLNLFSDVKEQNRILTRHWGEVAQVWLDLALHAKREDVRMTAIDRMYMYVIQPGMEDQGNLGNEEADYLDFITKNADNLDPMSVAQNLPTDSPDSEASGELAAPEEALDALGIGRSDTPSE